MKATLCMLAAVFGATGLAVCRQGQAAERPVDVFRAWDGTWRGTFVGYDLTGDELYRIAVEQTYRTVDAHTQRVEIRDRMANGEVVTGRGENTARRLADGSLALRCRVEKSTGDVVEHRGRIVKGPGGRDELVWYSIDKNREESFREWVERRGDGRAYFIHGVGRYGGKSMLMAGEYRAVE